MTLDLVHCYKMLRQRANRRAKKEVDWDAELLADWAGEIVKGNKTHDERLVLARKMMELEESTVGSGYYYGRKIYQALDVNDYSIDVPHVKSHVWNETADAKGYAYVASAFSRPKMSKLGATSYDPAERLKRYSSRYGYPVQVYWSREILRPFAFEASIAKELRERRFAGLTRGDSNEWYCIEPDEMKSIVELALKNWPK